MSQVLETLVSDETRSQQSSTSVEGASASPISLPSSSAQAPFPNYPTGPHVVPSQDDEYPSRLPPSDDTPGKQKQKQKHKQDKDNPIEGLSSFSAHSTNAIDFLHKISDAKCDDSDGTEIEELLDSMHAIVDAVKVRRQSTQSLFPHSNPAATQRTPTELPPIQVAVAAIREAQGDSSHSYSPLLCGYFPQEQ